MKYTVLQFCDFYTATMAYWVTVLAMGGLPDQAKSLLHMVGAVGVALAIEYDRTGVFTFLVPAVIGIFILISSWVSRLLVLMHTFYILNTCYAKMHLSQNDFLWEEIIFPSYYCKNFGRKP